MQLQPTTPVTIYALRDPETGTPAYVGQTTQPLARRLRSHIYEGHKWRCQRGQWIERLRAQGKRPTIVALEITDHAHADEREYFHIARLWAEGHSLTNSTGAAGSRTQYPGRPVDVVMDGVIANGHPIPLAPKAPSPEQVSIAEAAKILGVHPHTVRNRVQRGLYPTEKCYTPHGPAYMISRAVLTAGVAGHAQDVGRGRPHQAQHNGAHSATMTGATLHGPSQGETMDTNEPTSHPNGDRLSVAEAAQMLGIHQNTLRARLKKGRYPHEQVLTPYGPAYAIPRAAVEADLATALQAPHSDGWGSNGSAPGDTALSVPLHLLGAVESALAPLVDELARARAAAAAAHERAGRLQAERDAAILERNVERTRRYEREQRRPWWRVW